MSSYHAYLRLVAEGGGKDYGVSGSISVCECACSVMYLFSLLGKALSVFASMKCWVAHSSRAWYVMRWPCRGNEVAL